MGAVGWGIASLGATAQAQVGAGIAPHVGSLGFGVDLAVALHPRLALRTGANVFPFSIDVEASDIAYDIELPSPSISAVLDVYPVGGFRISGGLVTMPDLRFVGDFLGAVEVGERTYTGADVGRLIGVVTTRDVSPYVGIGTGHPVGRRRVALFVDAGIALHGTPGFRLTADGPLAANPLFRADLERERREIEEDIDDITVYPVLSIGVMIRLTG